MGVLASQEVEDVLAQGFGVISHGLLIARNIYTGCS
jgi:hypothetical protein